MKIIVNQSKNKQGFMSMLLIFTLLISNVFNDALLAQNNTGNRKISGVIVDDKGLEAIGANVVVKGSKSGTITDSFGKFSIDAPAKSTLVITYIGYETQEVKIGDPDFYKITIKENNKMLDEVVVVGYGTVSKRSYTGSASTVKSEQLSEIKTMTPTQSLQGRAAGVNVTTSSGMPGAPTTIRVRGVNSINSGNDPLWIIDGVPLYSGKGLEASSSTVAQDPMSMINANDIETMEVLKDAAATAIYGSRGSNGVIIITTKSGKKLSAKGSIAVDYTTGFSNLSRNYKDIGYASTTQWLKMADIAVQNQSADPTKKFNPSDVLALANYSANLTREQAETVNSNWFEQVTRTGMYQDINVNLVRGFEKGSVYTSFNYRNDQGMLKNNDMNRLTGRINTEYQVIKNLQVGSNLAFSHTTNNRVKTGYAGALGQGGGTTGAFEAANRNALPWLPVDSIFDHNPTGYFAAKSGNLAANNDRRFLRDYVTQARIVGNAFAEFNIEAVKGLSVRSEFGLDYLNNSSVDWRSNLITLDGLSYALDQNSNRLVLNYNAYMKYNHKFGVHGFNAVLGTESMRMQQWSRLMEGKDVIGLFPEIGSTAPRQVLSMSSGLTSEDYLKSYFFRGEYRLLDKYIVMGSFRRDGSSKFLGEANNTRDAFFTALSGGWIVTEESFMSDISKTLNMLKLKVSFGQTGNNAIPSGAYIMGYSNSQEYLYGPKADISAGTVVKNIGNSAVTWETTSNLDGGIDFGLWKNRISGSLEFYKKDVTGLLLLAKLPVSTGIGGNSIWQNIGNMMNYGVEFNVNSNNINTKQFNWSTDFNIAYNKNKVVSLTPELNAAGKGVAYSRGTQNVTGERLGTFLMADYAGIDPDHGVEMIYEIDREVYDKTGKTIKTGRKIPATTENVQKNPYFHKDKTVIPSIYGGLNNTFKAYGFDLSIFLTFSVGNYIYDYNRMRTSYIHNGQTVLLADVNESTMWAPGKTDAKYPLQSFNSSYPNAGWTSTLDDPNFPAGNKKGWWDPTLAGNYNVESSATSKYLYKGDFLKIKNISLGYLLPKSIVSKAYMEQLKVFVQCTNIFTFTAYPGYDPEGLSYVQAYSLPNPRTISVGLSAKF